MSFEANVSIAVEDLQLFRIQETLCPVIVPATRKLLGGSLKYCEILHQIRKADDFIVVQVSSLNKRRLLNNCARL
jgi:hypothetical protein